MELTQTNLIYLLCLVTGFSLGMFLMLTLVLFYVLRKIVGYIDDIRDAEAEIADLTAKNDRLFRQNGDLITDLANSLDNGGVLNANSPVPFLHLVQQHSPTRDSFTDADLLDDVEPSTEMLEPWEQDLRACFDKTLPPLGEAGTPKTFDVSSHFDGPSPMVDVPLFNLPMRKDVPRTELIGDDTLAMVKE